jgi:hypothetical protein
MTLPNFLVIGAARAGTSILYECLKQHPQVYVSSMKEPRFFAFEGEEVHRGGPGEQRIITNLEAYCALFERVSSEIAIGEVSPLYLYSSVAPQRIRHHIPGVRLIAILRDPAERAYSHFLLNVRNQREPITDFGQALQAEETRIRNGWRANWHYKQRGYYYAQLERYLRLFDPGQVRVYLYDDVRSDPLGLLQDVFRFLGVDDTFAPDVSFRANVSGMPRSKFLHEVLARLALLKPVLRRFLGKEFRRRMNVAYSRLYSRNLYKPSLPPDVRAELVQAYREDILRLQDLLQRDLTSWLE